MTFLFRTLLFLLICFNSQNSVIECARILGVFPAPMPSHFFLGQRLLKELALKNHEVTMISPFPQETPVTNYKDVSLKGMDLIIAKEMSSRKETNLSYVQLGEVRSWKRVLFAQALGSKISEKTFSFNSVQQLLTNKSEHFDVIIMELFHTEILYGLAHHFDCPVIVLSTMCTTPWTNALVANPAPPSYVPDFLFGTSGQMTFLQRFVNVLHSNWVTLQRNFVYLPQVNKKLHESNLFPDAPSLDKLIRKYTALILLNSHPAVTEARPILPSMVEIGGFHIPEPKKLPADLQQFMDSAQDGVIYFSMGSFFRNSDLRNETLNLIMRTFAKLKQRVVWKWEVDDLPERPSNVRIVKWSPQNDILAHSNLKAFITHGGLLSTTEAIYHGVPMVGIPIFGDQPMNVAIMENKGYGIALCLQTLTQQSFSAALNEVLNNPKYTINVKKMSRIFRDQPIKPLELAIYWIEFIARHTGAPHLRTTAIHLNLFQLYMLDVILFIFLIILALLFIIYYVVKKILHKNYQKNKKDFKQKSN